MRLLGAGYIQDLLLVIRGPHPGKSSTKSIFFDEVDMMVFFIDDCIHGLFIFLCGSSPLEETQRKHVIFNGAVQ